MVHTWCAIQRAVSYCIADNFFDLLRLVAECTQRLRHSPVDDLEIAATREFLEFHQREIRFNAGRIAIHDKADRACWCDNSGLRIAVAIFFAHRDRKVPRGPGMFYQISLRAMGRIKRHRVGREILIGCCFAVSRSPVVAHYTQHMAFVFAIAREGTQLLRHLRRGGIGNAGHDRGNGTTDRTGFF